MSNPASEKSDATMTIRTKVLIATSVLLVMAIGSVLSFLSLNMLGTLKVRESEDLIWKSRVAVSSVRASVKEISAATRDWSSWDETYAYVRGENPGFLEERLNEYPLTLYKLDMIIVLDGRGKPLNEIFYDYKEERYAEKTVDLSHIYPKLSEDVKKRFDESENIVLTDTDQIGKVGFVMAGGKLVYLSAFPVIRSDETGPMAGTMIFGRIITDDQLMNVLGEQHSGIMAKSLEDSCFDDLRPELAQNSAASRIFSQERQIEGYIRFDSIFKSGIVICVREPRVLFEDGISVLMSSMLILAAISVVIFILVITLLSKMVLNPLFSLSREVELIGRGKERIDIPQTGAEIRLLGRSINTLLERQEEDLRLIEEANLDLGIYKQAVSSASDDVLLFDIDENVVFANPSFLRNTGYAESEVGGKKFWDFIGEEYLTFSIAAIREAIFEGRPWTGDLSIKRKNGEKTVYDARISKVSGQIPNPGYCLVIMQNIDQHRKYERMLMHMAQFDALTELPNRALFQDRLSGLIAKHQDTGMDISMLLIDLDGFKYINDSFGHTAGDKVLSMVAERLVGNLPDAQCIARMGGDEFAVLFSGRDIIQLDEIANRILGVFSEPFRIGGQDYRLTASVGSSVYPYDGKDVETIIRNADAALYNAKGAGKNAHRLYTADLSSKISRRLRLESALRDAVLRKDFVVHYQPIVLSGTGKICGCEALVRWTGKEGLILPSEFIPLAEETGLIIPITEFVLKEACAVCGELCSRGHDIRMSVNFSEKALSYAGLFNMLRDALDHGGVSAENLDVEITEGTLIAETSRSGDVLRRLSDMGVSVSVDDFGTGYSSLSYIKRLAPNKIKIDRSFICDLPEDADSAAIVRAILSLARGLGIETIAEGVETEEQLSFISENGCGQIQGYYISYPLPKDELIRFFDDSEAKGI